jgi:hypothetical protein
VTSASLAARRSRGSLVVRLALAIALLGSFAVLGIPGQAHAADNGKWAATPLQQSNSFTPRQYFVYAVTAGQTLDDTLFLDNRTTAPLHLILFGSDAINAGGGGGFAVKTQTQKQTDVGSWIHLSTNSVTIPAAKGKTPGTLTVPFTVTVPRGASPGDHAGGIVTLNPSGSSESTGSQGVNGNITLVQAITVRMYIRVAGPLTPQLIVTNTSLKVTPALLPFVGSKGHSTLTYTIRNVGNVRLTPNIHIAITGLFGHKIHDLGTTGGPEVLPGQSVTLSSVINGIPALDQAHARIVLTVPASGSPTGKPLVFAGDVLSYSLSWLALLLLLIIIGLIVFFIWRRRRKSTTKEGRRGGGTRSAGRSREPSPVG